ncbi:MAG: NUDIX hydrolase, partial [Rhodocyclaceae bacterium]
ARLLDLDFSAGHETLEVALFEEARVPWQHIAFQTIAMTLRHFFADRRQGNFGLHLEALTPPR